MLLILASSTGFFFCIEEIIYICMCELEREKSDWGQRLTLGYKGVTH